MVHSCTPVASINENWPQQNSTIVLKAPTSKYIHLKKLLKSVGKSNKGYFVLLCVEVIKVILRWNAIQGMFLCFLCMVCYAYTDLFSWEDTQYPLFIILLWSDCQKKHVKRMIKKISLAIVGRQFGCAIWSESHSPALIFLRVHMCHDGCHMSHLIQLGSFFNISQPSYCYPTFSSG